MTDQHEPCDCGQDHTDELRHLERVLRDHAEVLERSALTLHELDTRTDAGDLTPEESRRARAAACLEVGASAAAVQRARGASSALAGMVGAISATGSLHTPRWDVSGCRGCDSPSWPCPTMTVLTLESSMANSVQTMQRTLAARWS